MKVIRKIFTIFAGGIIAVCLILAVLLLGLRTDFASNTIAKFAKSLLDEQGIYISFDSLEGPLPSRLFLQNIRVADSKGAWFTASALECRANLWTLLRGEITISLFRVEQPELFRIPEAKSPDAEKADKNTFSLAVPLALSLAKLSIKDAIVHEHAVFSTHSKATTPDPALIRASLIGTAGLKPNGRGHASIQLNATAGNPKWLAELLGIAAFPIREIFLSLDSTASLREDMRGTVSGSVRLVPAILTDALSADFAVTLNSVGPSFAMQRFSAQGLGISLKGSGEFHSNSEHGQITLSLNAKDGGAWQSFLEQTTKHHFGGELTADLIATLTPSRKADAAFTLTGSNLRWPTPQLQEIFGARAHISAQLAGGDAKPYVLSLNTLEAGILTSKGEALFWPESANITLSMKSQITDVSALAPGYSGPAKANLSISGAPSSLDFSFSASSESLRIHPDVVVKAHANFDGNGIFSDGAMRQIEAKSHMNIQGSPAGPVHLNAALSIKKTPQGDLSSKISKLSLNFPGVTLAADINATIPQGTVQKMSLDGTVKADAQNISFLNRLSSLPIAGEKLSLSAAFSHTDGIQHAKAAFGTDTFSMGAASGGNLIALHNIACTLELTGPLENPDIVFSATAKQGEAGPFQWETGALRVQMSKDDGFFALSLRDDSKAQATLQNLERMKTGHLPPEGAALDRLITKGTVKRTSKLLTITALGLSLPASSTRLGLLNPITVSWENGLAISQTALKVTPGKGTVVGKANISQAKTDLNLKITELPAKVLSLVTDMPLPDGSLNLTAEFKKQGSAISGATEITALVAAPDPLGQKNAQPPVKLSLQATIQQKKDTRFPQLQSDWARPRLTGSASLNLPHSQTTNTTKAVDATCLFSIPLAISQTPLPVPDLQAPLGASLTWRGEVAPVWGLLPLTDRYLSGRAMIDARVKGTIAKPEYAIQAYLADGRFRDDVLGLLLSGIQAEMVSASTGITNLLISAKDGKGGNAAFEGTLSPPPKNSREKETPLIPLINVRGHVDRLSPLHRDDLDLMLSARISVKGPLTGPVISAKVEIEKGEVSLLSTLGSGVTTLDINPADMGEHPAQTKSKGPSLDISVAVPNRFFIRGRGLDSEWEGNLSVTGQASHPSLKGILHPVRGSLDLLSKTFFFSGGDISFFDGGTINPSLNLSLTHKGPSLTALVKILGTAEKPKLVMESSPPMPQDQILAQVLFGKDASSLSRFEALQVANSVRQLASIGSSNFDILGTMRTQLGLDMLRIGSSGDDVRTGRSIAGAPEASQITGKTTSSQSENGNPGAPTLEAGKYINDAIFIGIEQGAASDSTGVRVEVELMPNLTLQGKTTPQASEVGIGWKKDY